MTGRLVLVTPVADRAWALPAWFAHLAAQTVRPDALAFVHSGRIGDATWRAIEDGAAGLGVRALSILHDDAPPHPRHDDRRFATLARLRNRALNEAVALDADLVLSLDTDIMLRDPFTVERLCELVAEVGCDIAGPVAFLHPAAPPAWEPGDRVCWAYNFGWLASPGDPQRCWLRRPHVNTIDWGATITADVPMGCWVANHRAAACRYEWHESGEDIGFARALQHAGCRFRVDTSLYAWHCWSAKHLAEHATAVT